MNDAWIERLDALAPLRGRTVILEPLTGQHVEPLTTSGLDPELWRWTVSVVASAADMETYVDTALQDRRRGLAYPFAIREVGSGAVVGSTRFGNIDAPNRRLEIGWTWIGREVQRTAVNTEAKYLLLRTAFEDLDCLRVELKTDALNQRSRTAIERIGARQEGVLRQHMITATGRLRDTVYYSILDSEWPDAKRRLFEKLGGQF